MNSLNTFIASNPTGTGTIINNKVKLNHKKKNIKTSAQASADINNKINKNEYVCNNIATNENFSNLQVRYNNSILIYIFFILLILLIIYIIYYLIKK